MQARLPTTLGGWALAILGGAWSLVFAVLVTGFCTALAEQAGWFSEPEAKVTAFLNFIQALPGNYAFAWAAGLLLGSTAGFAAGVWLDAIRRVRSPEPEAPVATGPRVYPWNPGGRVPYAVWDQIEVINLAQAAYLWSDLEPPPNGVPITAQVNAFYLMLLQAAQRGDLQTQNPMGVRAGQVFGPMRQTTRAHLIEYADRIGQHPRFLFPDARPERA